MKKGKVLLYFLLGMVLTFGMVPSQVKAVPVDLELSLVVDVSGSINDVDFALQKAGYVNSFTDPAIYNAIMAGGTYHAIAVNLIYFSTAAVQSVGWTLINDAASSIAFANAIAATGRPSSGSTGIAGGLNLARTSFANSYEGTRLVIDVSGDGSENVTTLDNLHLARDNAIAGGVTTINGLVIFDRTYFGDGVGYDEQATLYYTNNVIGGLNPFVEHAVTWNDFEGAIHVKLAKEITGVPEPATMLLLGIGLVGLIGFRKKFKK